MNILVLSGGTWGISLALLLLDNGHRVTVWEHSAEVVETLRQTRRHPRLENCVLPAELVIDTALEALLPGSEAIVCAVPAAHLRQTCQRVAQAGYGGQLFVICTKGIEQETLALPVEVAQSELGREHTGQIGILSGPSHAEEVSRKLPTAVVAAAETLPQAEKIRDLFLSARFRVYTQTDLTGVELGAALKNVIAIACGISDGLGYGDNAKAGLITRGLAEISRLALLMGAQPETLAGLAGLGDLVVTCMSQHSRNWRFGSLIGQGNPPQAALQQVGMVVEGYYTVRAAIQLAGKIGCEMPITAAVGGVLFEGLDARRAVEALMGRVPKSEMGA